MRIAKGPLEPLNDSLNRPTSKFGINYQVLLYSVMGAVPVFLFISKAGAIEALIVVLVASWLVVRKDPQWPVLWLLSCKQKSYYDPGK